ncbi:tetratricopeptide repeat protein [Anaerostipes hadrus]|uniref:tetratricopeptide repeat protein n=2 Tax=Lachnospirales TaxID=3085636 RepID=UPI001D091325|nr:MULTISPECIES: tetratricopeptide repeat protein [Lachnospiraceae]MCB6722883.1 tetratricopeptide repeat protein [Blautia marasmi]MCB6993198.1 tetratricopeptide repeat protein [bacterium 210820-DFI.6.37]MCB6356393.1 tetratricopeptide repeat protein [Blautia wexlerae]MCB6728862.1 tetratricopeptide repeat protein [Blautia obeum]MCB6740883.1 tetratricopeptide repeat protein [Blautia sp. 210820-DFI.6.14]
MSQPEFLYEIFEDFLDSPENKEFTLDNGLVCRWMTGQAKISPKISSFYAKPSNQEKLAKNIQQNILPLMADYSRTLQDIYTLFIQDSSISEAKKAELAPLYKPADLRLLFLAKLISFGMERPFIKRDTKNQKLIAGGSLSPMVLDYIMDSEVPRPCRHFVGREDETTELHSLLEDNSKAFLYGIAGIGKSELAKSYAKYYKKHYTNILYFEYAGDLHQSVTDMDFADDLPEDTEEERFRKHNRFLRSLKDDTLIIIDNFNATATQDSFLSVMLKYRCRILFTTRSKFDSYCTLHLKEIKESSSLFQLVSSFYSEAEEHRAIVEKIIETVHYHTFAVELAAKLLENGILAPHQLLIKLQEEKASLHNEDKIKVMKDGQSSNATYYNHIHTLFSLYSLSRKQRDIMCNMCFLPSSGISARIFSKWLELSTLNDVNDLIETGFVQSSLRHTISLHPMIQEIAVSETAPSVTNCHTLLDSLQKICLMHGIEVSYYKKLFQTVENIMLFIEKDDIPQYLLFLEDVFPYMEKYHYQKGMKKIIQELQHFIKANTYGTASDRALLLDYQATLEPKTEKAIKLEKEALAQIKETTKENAHLVSNLHSNLGGLYRINGQLDLAKKHMKMGISLLEQYQLLYTNDSIPQITNYAVLLTEMQEPALALSALRKLAQIIKEYNSNHCLDYAQVQESLGSICLITANISQAKTHFKKALKIYEDIWADEPELIEKKYKEIQELYPQAGIALAKSILLTKH